MNQICRKMKKFGSVMLAMLMAVSIFDANLIFAQDEATGNVKLTQTCDHENIKPNENGELLIPWNDTIATTSSEFVSFSNYEAEMKEHQHATPDTFQLQITEETGGETRTLVEGTDFALFYFNPTNELYTDKKDEIETFQKFKVDFLKKDKTFYAINIKYQTINEITTLKETEENRQFDIEGTWNADEPIKATGTYVYSNPNYKVVEEEPVKEETNVSNEIKDHENQKNEVNQITSNKTSKTVSNGEEPTSPYGTYPERYKVWDFTTAEEHKNDHYNSIVGNQYKYGDFGESKDYNLFYILANYNVFTFSHCTGTHIVGPMAVGGNTVINGVGGVTQNFDNQYYHTVPSIFNGFINRKEDVDSSNQNNPNGNTGNNQPSFSGASGALNLITMTDMPVFISVDNDQNGNDANHNNFKTTLTGTDKKLYLNYYLTEQNNESSQYMDFTKAKASIENQMAKYSNSNFSGNDAAGHPMQSIVVKKSDYEKIINVGDKVMSDDGTYSFEISDDSGKIKGLRLKLGYNYVFEKDIIGNLEYIVYDYENLEEATAKTTLLNVPDEGKTSFPRMLKSQSDSLGNATQGGIGINADPMNDIDIAYNFSSSEVEKAFNVVYLIPKVNELIVDKRLVGHLVAPNAKVSIACGDYNGGVIAKEVYSTSEGHMWPFKLDGYISFDKTVDGKRPESNEKFTFNLKNVSRPDKAKPIEDMTAQNNTYGEVLFTINNLEVEGNYVFEIKEKDPGAGYAENNQVYYALLSLEQSKDELGGGRLLPVFKGFYESYDKATNTLGKELAKVTFNNKRVLSVEKKWLDDSGNEIVNTDDLPEVKGILKQKYVEDVGCQITYNLYNIGSQKELIKTVTTKPLIRDKSYVVEIKNLNQIKSVKIVSGDGKYSAKDNKEVNEVMITDIKTDLVVDINVIGFNGLDIDMLSDDSRNTQNIAKDPETGITDNFAKEFTLNKGNEWCYKFEDELPSSEVINGKRYKYSYFVQEMNIPGFEVSYSTKEGILTGTIVITNKAKPSDLKIQKVSSTGNNKHLEGAIFQLHGKNNELIKFKQSDKKYEYDKSGNVTDLISNSDGLVNLSNLPVGDYVLVETKAPDGFVIEYKEIPIHIDYDKYKSYYKLGDKETKFFNQQSSTDTEVGKIEYQFTVENIPDIKVPETGGTPGNPYQKIGFLIACCGFAMFAMYEYKRHKNIEESKN